MVAEQIEANTEGEPRLKAGESDHGGPSRIDLSRVGDDAVFERNVIGPLHHVPPTPSTLGHDPHDQRKTVPLPGLGLFV